MPANRSRTQQWRRCLQQIHERNGALEIAVAHDDRSNSARTKRADADGEQRSTHLVWRVRLLAIHDDQLVVEAPVALGQVISLRKGVELIAVIAIGQNRWMFRTQIIEPTRFSLNERRDIDALRIVMPTNVERCQRRNFYRMDTAALNLPQVEVWPLLDPQSVLVAERANEIRLQNDVLSNGAERSEDTSAPPDDDDESIMPEVGPRFVGALLNLGGGGLGLRVEQDNSQHLGHHKLFWVRIALPPELNTPICATGKLVHTHLESGQYTYAGLAFDFSFNPGHQRFVVDQICRYIALQQRIQLQRMRATE